MEFDDEEFWDEEEEYGNSDAVDLEAHDDEEWGSDFGEDGNYTSDEDY